MYDADEPEEDEDGETPADERSAEEKKIPNAIAGLTEIQAACAARGFPKGLLQSIFVRLHQDDIVKESGIFGWKDDTGASVEADGKGTALLQLNKWLEWLQEDEEEEDEEEEPEEADMGDVMKPNNSSMY